ncbi:hypothetical protein GCM10020001_117670 [Nonomuraea salmonea]
METDHELPRPDSVGQRSGRDGGQGGGQSGEREPDADLRRGKVHDPRVEEHAAGEEEARADRADRHRAHQNPRRPGIRNQITKKGVSHATTSRADGT